MGSAKYLGTQVGVEERQEQFSAFRGGFVPCKIAVEVTVGERKNLRNKVRFQSLMQKETILFPPVPETSHQRKTVLCQLWKAKEG